jgi:hypothetical protein
MVCWFAQWPAHIQNPLPCAILSNIMRFLSFSKINSQTLENFHHYPCPGILENLPIPSIRFSRGKLVLVVFDPIPMITLSNISRALRTTDS